jgi:hypothetical protein
MTGENSPQKSFLGQILRMKTTPLHFIAASRISGLLDQDILNTPQLSLIANVTSCQGKSR